MNEIFATLGIHSTLQCTGTCTLQFHIDSIDIRVRMVWIWNLGGHKAQVL